MCTVHKLMHSVGGVDYRTWFDKASDSEKVTRVAADSLNVKVKNGRLDLRKKLFLCAGLQPLERGPHGDEGDHAGPPVQAGIQAAQGRHVDHRLEASQDQDRMPRAVCKPGTDVLQEGLPGPWRTTLSSKQVST